MKGYIETVYDDNIRPRTDYPKKLCRHLVDRFKFPQGGRILDLGCGRGEFLEGFKENGLEVFGLDRDPNAAKCTNVVEVKTCDFEKHKFPYPDNTFDIVFSKSVVEHFFDPENFILESFRVLKPGGRIVMMTPDWKSTVKIFFDDYTHRQPYTTTAAKELLDIFGFQKTQAEIFYQLPILWQYPVLKVFSRILQVIVPVTAKSRIKFIRWSVELMVLATGVK